MTASGDGGSEGGGADRERRLVAVSLDEASLAAGNRDIDHERKVAIFDLLEHNSFSVVDGPPGPYALSLSIVEGRLVFDIRLETGEPGSTFILSLTPFRRIVRDYFMICESYFQAIRTAPRRASRRSTWAAGACTTRAARS